MPEVQESRPREVPPKETRTVLYDRYRAYDLREFAGISREIASERAGITVEYLGEVERGEKWPTLKVIRSIARGLHVSPATFFDFKDEQSGTPIETLHAMLENRTPEQQQQILRVVRALLGI
ncbi:MAG: helix-turn-helix domain-containing protein [Candidatus Acidiferrales bacterium]